MCLRCDDKIKRAPIGRLSKYYYYYSWPPNRETPRNDPFSFATLVNDYGKGGGVKEGFGRRGLERGDDANSTQTDLYAVNPDWIEPTGSGARQLGIFIVAEFYTP